MKSAGNSVASALEKYSLARHRFDLFRKTVVSAFELDPVLNSAHSPIIHSVKSRLKDPEHLKAKLLRKVKGGKSITEKTIFTSVTDLAGVRVLHLHLSQAKDIHDFVIKRATDGDWILVESPVAYSWDPDAIEFFKKMQIEVSVKDSHYTSVHYVIKPNASSDVTCEIQVRTLLEEVWGEIDHRLNYPDPSDSQFVIEQLRVLAKLVSTGSRLADSIFRLHATSVAQRVSAKRKSRSASKK
jgi:putative GTP pyrophosphokinase